MKHLRTTIIGDNGGQSPAVEHNIVRGGRIRENNYYGRKKILTGQLLKGALLNFSCARKKKYIYIYT